MLLTSSTLSFMSTPSCRTLSACRVPGTFCFQKKQIVHCCSIHNLKDERKREVPYDNLFQVSSRQNGYISYSDENLRRRLLLFISVTTVMFPTLSSSGKTKSKSPYDEKRLLEQNRRVQKENNAPEDFPSFIREGFDVNVVTSENYTKCDSGLIYRDFEVGKGDCPKDGQQVIFHYIGYNESGRRIDSTYLQGTPAKIRLGNNALVPGFEKGIRDMRPGGKRRIIIPPELGPPVGPSTFFSSKQFEVFDVELLSIQDCQRRTIAFYSDVVCN